MTFGIRFKADDEEKLFDGSAASGMEGRITIGEFWESFFAATVSWSVADYEASWTRNVGKLRNGEDAFFVTDVGSPDSELLFRCWPAFNSEGVVLFTEKLLLRSNVVGGTGVEDIPALIGFDDLKQSVGDGVSFWQLRADEL